MTNFILKTYDTFSRHKILAWIILLLVLVLAGVSVMNLHYEEDIAAFLPQNEESRKYSSVYGELGGNDRIAVFFSMREENPDSTDLIISAMDRFGELWAETDTTGMVGDMQISSDDMQVADVMAFIRENIPYFLDESDYRRIDSLLASPSYISERLDAARRALILPSSAYTVVNLRYDPLNLYSAVYGKLQQLNIASDNQIIDSHIFMDEGRRGVVFFTSAFGQSESGRNAELAVLLDRISAMVEEEFPEVELSATGGPLIAVANAERIKKDSIIAVLISSVLICLLLFFAFRNLKDILWIAFSVLCGVLLALGALAVFKDEISVIILGIGSVIIGIAVNYPLHYIDHRKHCPDGRSALKDVISPLLTGNITTVCAFLSLLLLRAEALRDFGMVSASILVGTIVFVLLFLPALMGTSIARNTRAADLNFDRHIPASIKRRAMLPFLLLTLIFAFFGSRIQFDSDVRNINYMTDSQREGLALLSSAATRNSDLRDSLRLVYAVAEGEDIDAALRANENLLATLDASLPEGAQIRSISRLIPSTAEQEKRLELWDNFRNIHADLVPELQKRAAVAGFSPNAFAPFTGQLAADFKLVEPEFFRPLFATVGKASLIETAEHVRLVDYVEVLESSGDAFKENIRAKLSEKAFVFDSSDVGNQLVNLLSEDFNLVGLICSFIVFFFLWLSFGSFELALLSFLPLAVGWLWILGLMQLFGLQFNIVNIILATFIFGQGDDYTIFITEGLLYENTYGRKILDSYKSSVALSALLMLIGIGCLIFAVHPAMKSLAQVTIIGMCTVVLMAYYLPPAVFGFITRRTGSRYEVPLTLKRFVYSLGAMSFFLLAVALIVPCTAFYFLTGRKDEQKKLRYHRFLQKVFAFISGHIPGVNVVLENAFAEDFYKPAVIISNHQSHLDVVFLLMLSPKIAVLTNDWVWNSPFYKWIIRYAEYYPVSDGIENNISKLEDLVSRGYSILVFPEGTRSADGSIGRFHRGAFYLAEQLKMDILPVFLHGISDVLPKKDFMLREGRIYVEIGRRIFAGDALLGEGYQQRTKELCRYYRQHFAEISAAQEDAYYNLTFVKYAYLYKTSEIRSCAAKELSRRAVDFVATWRGRDNVYIENSGCGAFARLFALSHRHIQVYAYEADESMAAAARHCAAIPDNLHFIVEGLLHSSEGTDSQDFVPEEIIELPKILES